MLELGIFLGILFLVLVFFYKQKVEDFRISQIEYTQLERLPDLLTELNPIVVRGVPPPTFLTPDTLAKNNRIQNFPVSNNGLTLHKWLQESSSILSQQPQELRATLASELGIPMWAEHLWFEPLTSEILYSSLMTIDAEAWLSNMGMQKTMGAATIFYPTHGSFTCSLLLESSTKFLSNWEGRFLSDFNQTDTPLLHEVQFLDVKLRPSHMLIVPPHWIVSMKAENDVENPMFAMIELHHPISKLSKALG